MKRQTAGLLPLLLAALVVAAPAAVLGAAEASDAEVCNGVPGLCSVPIGQVLFLGTHNSAAVAPELACPLKRQFANQAAPIMAQIAAGARALNIDADFKGGSLVFSHGFCANGVTRPRALFDALGDWLIAHATETLLLNFDDNQQRGYPDITATMLRQLEAGLAASKLGPLLAPRPLTAATPLRALRGRAVVVVDAGSWGGGGVWGSRGLWLKVWSEAGGPTSYVGDPAAAVRTRDAVAAQLVEKFSSDDWAPKEARCGAADGGVPFRSISFGSADWSCKGGGGLEVCQLPLLAAATNTYDHIATTLRATSKACGAAAESAAAPPGANVIYIDFTPPTASGSVGSATALGPAQLVQDWNTATAVGYRGCSWGGGRGAGVELQCAGVPSRRLADTAQMPSENGLVVVADDTTSSERPVAVSSAAVGSQSPPAAAARSAAAALQVDQAAAATGVGAPQVSGSVLPGLSWTLGAAAILASLVLVGM